MEASDWNETSELKYLTHWMPLPSPPDDVAAPAEQQAAPKAAHEWQVSHTYGGEICANCGAVKGTRRGNAPCGEAAAPTTQPAPTYKDSTPEMHVGDSAFESWYSTYNPAHKGDKQRARDAYAAGMGDPLVMASPAAVGVEPVAWKHDCAALLTNDVELWIDACPHCGKPRNAPQPVGREPMTHAQAKALVSKYGNDPLHLVYQVEVAHGITGGQHGTE